MCSTDEAFKKECALLKDFFLNIGYPVDLVIDLTVEVSSKRLEGFLTPLLSSRSPPSPSGRPLDTLDPLPLDPSCGQDTIVVDTNKDPDFSASFITAFNTNSRYICSIMRKNCFFIMNSGLHDRLGLSPIFTYRRGNNLKDILQRNTKCDHLTRIKGTSTCGCCKWCRYLRVGNSFIIGERKYFINHKINCKTKAIVYVAFCQCCAAFYVGKTDRRFCDHIYQHIYAINNKKSDNALSKHILNSGHSFLFMGIDHISMDIRGGPQSLIVETRELEWQLQLDAFSFPGLNENCNIAAILKYKSYLR
ncbi:uncharacterized protein LOC122794786 [Protopterus annectens]|uniref:uncharacterized protein LOC122794786 n=1 Tax=Protopterus annectens TaxID=7888 RepID=UPI001CFB0A5A|nr:uncharacterized protein LOC122794786 [Protopterus annectens]